MRYFLRSEDASRINSVLQPHLCSVVAQCVQSAGQSIDASLKLRKVVQQWGKRDCLSTEVRAGVLSLVGLDSNEVGGGSLPHFSPPPPPRPANPASPERVSETKSCKSDADDSSVLSCLSLNHSDQSPVWAEEPPSPPPPPPSPPAAPSPPMSPADESKRQDRRDQSRHEHHKATKAPSPRAQAALGEGGTQAQGIRGVTADVPKQGPQRSPPRRGASDDSSRHRQSSRLDARPRDLYSSDSARGDDFRRTDEYRGRGRQEHERGHRYANEHGGASDRRPPSPSRYHRSSNGGYRGERWGGNEQPSFQSRHAAKTRLPVPNTRQNQSTFSQSGRSRDGGRGDVEWGHFETLESETSRKRGPPETETEVYNQRYKSSRIPEHSHEHSRLPPSRPRQEEANGSRQSRWPTWRSEVGH